MLKTSIHRTAGFALVLVLLAATQSVIALRAQEKATTPREQFAHTIGDDHFLVNYTGLVNYWKKLDRESDRMMLTEIGPTAEGRSMVMAILTSPENMRKLDRYREIARRLAKAEGIGDEEARALAREGKAVVWIDGGLHADETLGAQQLIEMVFQLVSRNDTETMRFLDDVIVLMCPANPDGMELVSDWYMNGGDLSRLPRLYEKYAGHDANRDFYMSALPETRAINRVLYHDWFPQIVYDHHQTGPRGSVMFAPPFRDPFNFNFDPLVIPILEEIGAAMQSRFVTEGKPGVTSRTGSDYSTWWNGGLRTSPYFHNMIGLLTETIGGPTPSAIPFVAGMQLPRNDLPFPVTPQPWRFSQSVEYSITANRAVLDYASRNKDRLLWNIYRMGRNSIERGSYDTWTASPHSVPGAQPANADNTRDPMTRDPRGYILSRDQADFPTATKFINTLLLNGVTVERALTGFAVNGKRYPAGSYAIKTAQAFRPHILDMFEPQYYPDDFKYPGANPTPPYDIAGWTLAYQMGVKFDRILDGFEGPFEKLTGEARPPAGVVSALPRTAGYLLSHQTNDSFIAINRLLGSGEAIYWVRAPVNLNGKTWPPGTNFIPAAPATASKLQKLAADLGLSFEAVPERPAGAMLQLHPIRTGLWDPIGSIPSGWTRLALENFEFPFVSVDSSGLTGDLIRKFDVLVFPGGELPSDDATPRLKQFLDDGGSILAIGASTRLSGRMGLPILEPLRAISSTVFYIPGSIVGARADITDPLAFGLEENVDLFFQGSPVFNLGPDARGKGVRSIVSFSSEKPLRSGWAVGQALLKDTSAVVEAPVGKGKLILYGPEILFRAQSHGTFKLLFNGLYAARAVRVDSIANEQ